MQPTNRNTAAYAGWANRLVTEEGYQPYLVTLMFRPLGGSTTSIDRQIERETERVYATLLTRVVRYPKRASAIGRLPIWFCCLDRPVIKRTRQSLRDVVPNDGRHLHAVALQPPWSRLHEDLVTHFGREYATYVHAGGALDHLDVRAITHRLDNVVDYVRKQVGRDRAGEEIAFILPRARSEVS